MKADLTIKPCHPKQGIWYKKARYKAAYGGRASFKSWGAVEALVYYARKYSIRILCTREVQKSLKDSVYQLILDTAERYGIRDEFYDIKDEIRHIYTGSRFIFAGLKTDPQKLKSLESIDLCYVEEAEGLSQDSIDILLPTIRKPNSQIWFVWNPQYPTDPINQLFLEGEPPPGSLIERFCYLDNPSLLSDDLIGLIEHDKKTNYERYLHVWEGGYKQESDNNLFAYDYIVAAVKRPTDATAAPLKAGLDVAREGGDRSVLAIVRGQKCVGLWSWEQMRDSMQLASLVADKLLDFGVNTIAVDSVGVGGPVADRIRRLVPKITVVDWKANSKALDEQKYQDRKAEAFHQLYEWMKDGSIPDRKELVDDLIQVEYDHDKKDRMFMVSKKVLKKRGVRSPDFADALAMAVNVRANFKTRISSTADESWA